MLPYLVVTDLKDFKKIDGHMPLLSVLKGTQILKKKNWRLIWSGIIITQLLCEKLYLFLIYNDYIIY